MSEHDTSELIEGWRELVRGIYLTRRAANDAVTQANRIIAALEADLKAARERERELLVLSGEKARDRLKTAGDGDVVYEIDWYRAVLAKEVADNARLAAEVERLREASLRTRLAAAERVGGDDLIRAIANLRGGVWSNDLDIVQEGRDYPVFSARGVEKMRFKELSDAGHSKYKGRRVGEWALPNRKVPLLQPVLWRIDPDQTQEEG